MKWFKKSVVVFLALIAIVLFFVMGLDLYIDHQTSALRYNRIEEIPPASTVIILGASVHSDGRLSAMLQDRVDTAFELFRQEKVQQFLVSGDHRSDDYDEVNAIGNYLLNKGIPPEKIILDHSGLDTYDSMYRSSAVFEIEDAIVVTQRFHLPRAIFIAKQLNLDYNGLEAVHHDYTSTSHLLRREKIANFKALWEILLKRPPKGSITSGSRNAPQKTW